MWPGAGRPHKLERRCEMTRFLALLAIAILLWIALEKVFAWASGVARGVLGEVGPKPGRRPAAPSGRSVELVRCHQCGVHIPRNRALPGASSRRLYCEKCSEEAHREVS